MKNIILRKETAKKANEAKISKRLIERLKAIADDTNHKDSSEAFAAYCFLKRLSRTDQFHKDNIAPDTNGWFKALYVQPGDTDDVEVAYEDGSTGTAHAYDGSWYNDDFKSVFPKKWRWIEE